MAAPVVAYLGKLAVEELLLTDRTYSSCISSASYDPDAEEVTLTFVKGGEGVYPMSLAEWVAYRAAPSKGFYFNAYIRGG